MSKLVSVIIPVYNREDKVGKAIESVIAQTYKYIEIIVIDDGSTDGTAKAIEKYCNNIKYFYKKNGGVSAARNLGIEASTGDLIAFLDSDDRWLPEKIWKQVNFLEFNRDVSAVLCECYWINEKEDVFGVSNRYLSYNDRDKIFNNILYNPSLIPSSFLVKKKVLFDVGNFDETLRTAEDQDLMLRIAAKYQFGLINEPLLLYMRGNEGLSQLSQTYDDTIYVMTRFLENQSDITSKDKEKIMCKHYLDSTLGKFWTGDYINMRKYLFLSFRNINNISGAYLFLKKVFFILKTCACNLVKKKKL